MKSPIHILKEKEMLVRIRNDEKWQIKNDGVKYEKEFGSKQSVKIYWSCNWGNCVAMVSAATFSSRDFEYRQCDRDCGFAAICVLYDVSSNAS